MWIIWCTTTSSTKTESLFPPDLQVSLASVLLGKCLLWKEPFDQMSLLLPGKPTPTTVGSGSVNISLLTESRVILNGFLSSKAPCGVSISLVWNGNLLQLLSLSKPVPNPSCSRMRKQMLRWDVGVGSSTNSLAIKTPSSLTERTYCR